MNTVSSDVSTKGQQNLFDKGVPAIEIRDLSKTFGTFHAVDHLTLTVQQGEVFGLLGPNGSGKTTTINMISGLSVPTKWRGQGAWL